MRLTKEQRAELRELHAKGTQGEWWYQESADNYTHIVRVGENVFITQFPQDDSGQAEASARLTADAHNALPGLLDDLDAAEAEIAAIKAVMITCRDGRCPSCGFAADDCSSWRDTATEMNRLRKVEAEAVALQAKLDAAEKRAAEAEASAKDWCAKANAEFATGLELAGTILDLRAENKRLKEELAASKTELFHCDECGGDFAADHFNQDESCCERCWQDFYTGKDDAEPEART